MKDDLIIQDANVILLLFELLPQLSETVQVSMSIKCVYTFYDLSNIHVALYFSVLNISHIL